MRNNKLNGKQHKSQSHNVLEASEAWRFASVMFKLYYT